MIVGVELLLETTQSGHKVIQEFHLSLIRPFHHLFRKALTLPLSKDAGSFVRAVIPFFEQFRRSFKFCVVADVLGKVVEIVAL